MDIQQKLTEAEQEIQLAANEINGWTIRKLRAEGVLIVLRQLAEESDKAVTSQTEAVPQPQS